VAEDADCAAEQAYAKELDRVVDRLRSMLITRLPVAADMAYDTTCQLLALSSATARLPRIQDHGAGDQLAVIGRDFAAQHPTDEQYLAATELLVDLRRHLP
jgi:hypothetical protein